MKDRPAFSIGYLMVACCVIAAVNGGTLECRREGRFPHPENCAHYVDCFRNARDVLVAREGHCHGYPYSPEKRRCVDHSEKPDCVTKEVRNSFRASDFNGLCAGNEFAAGCVNCKMTFSCIKGNATIGACDSKTVCDNTNPDFGYSVCLPPASISDDKCSCKKVGLVKDHHNPAYFHYCAASGALPEIFACEDDKEFNELNQACEVNPGQPTIPPCNGKIGTFVNPNDCSWSYTCLPGDMVRTTSCGTDEYFQDGACKKKCLFGAPTQIQPCTASGFFIYPGDCTKFLFCPSSSGSSEVKECPDGLFYNDDDKRCTDATLPKRCESLGGFDYLSCPGHDDVDFDSPCP
ncbi:uncharacterized protein LOC123516056 isoform X2 [Portunus trituberculatus]|uniref:uncharacterized protein LOC123516056 isoform X2 n=1 Tax=Portunus trituberculatus TaxID=210409 RepID=UPI001E1D217F|nr:uncharacterized protein LOC123516056 isoform X2 [Portunus trituberculatus]